MSLREIDVISMRAIRAAIPDAEICFDRSTSSGSKPARPNQVRRDE